MKFIRLFLIILCFPVIAHAANGTINGMCADGGKKVSVSGLNSTTTVQQSFPACLVTVYTTGTTNKATIYSNAGGTVLANPFTANADGKFLFYASGNAGLDVVISGGTSPNTLPSPLPILVNVFPSVPNGGGGVTKIIAGTNITIDPTSGVGDVTVNASGGGGSCTTDCVVTDPSGSQVINQPSGSSFDIIAEPVTGLSSTQIQLSAHSDNSSGATGRMQLFAGVLETAGNLYNDYVEVSSNFTFSDTALNQISYLTVNAASNPITITLAPSRNISPTIGDGHYVTITRLDQSGSGSNAVTIVPSTGGSIAGNSTLTLANNQSVTLHEGVDAPPSGTVTTGPYWLILSNTAAGNGGTTLQTNGTSNTSQTALNFTDTPTIAFTNPGTSTESAALSLASTGANCTGAPSNVSIWTDTNGKPCLAEHAAGVDLAGHNSSGLYVNYAGTPDLSLSSGNINVVGVNGASVPASQACVGTNSSSQLIAGSCGGGSLPSGTTNQMLYYASSGTTVSPLTLGTNLSITSGTLNASSTAATNFNALTSGTNTTAAMLVGTGASIGVTGTGTNNATAIGGITVTGTPTSGMVPTATSGMAATWQTPSSGGATISVVNPNTTPSISGSAFASKGGLFQPQRNVTLAAVWVLVGPTAAQTYQAVVGTASALSGTTGITLTATPTMGSTVTVPSLPAFNTGAVSTVWLRLPFSSPVTLTAGTNYFIGGVITSGTGTTVMPMSAPTGASVFIEAMPFFLGSIVRIAANPPVNGSSIDTNTNGVNGNQMGLEWQ